MSQYNGPFQKFSPTSIATSAHALKPEGGPSCTYLTCSESSFLPLPFMQVSAPYLSTLDML